MRGPVLRCAGLVHVYQEAGTDVAALRGVDLVVTEGQQVALLGPSGSGKSTLLSVAAGIMRPSAGIVEVVGVNLSTAPPFAVRRLRGHSLGLMLQGASTNLVLHENPEGNLAWSIRQSPDRPAAWRLGRRILRAGGMNADRRPVGAMTPAEQQVVALAVAMAPSPRLLLADEPTSQLDAHARDNLLDVLVEAAGVAGTAVLIVTHDEQVAARMQRMIHLAGGRIGEEATSEGRYSVIGADGSLLLPASLRTAWPPGTLVTVEEVTSGEVRVTVASPTESENRKQAWTS